MKKLKAIGFILLMFMFGTSRVYAACDFIETNRLSSLAVNVKASYEVEMVELDKSTYYPPDGLSEEEREAYVAYKRVFNIYITNITEELYVVVTDDINRNKRTYHYDETTDGVLTIVQEDLSQVNNYTITVYSSDKTDCPDTKLFTTTLTTPYYNTLSRFEICEGIEDFYLCHEYLTVEATSFEDFMIKAQAYKEALEKKEQEEEEEQLGFKEFVKEHIVLISGVIIGIIGVGAVVTVVIIKRKRSKSSYEKNN